MVYDAIQPAAFIPNPDAGPFYVPHYTLTFPAAWRGPILDLAKYGKPEHIQARIKQVPVKRLNAVMRALAPDLIAVDSYTSFDQDTPWLYNVHTDIPDDIVDEYNEWYDAEHLPRLVTVPGVVRARRYNSTSGNPRYLTAYELTDPDAFESPEGLKARKTPWTAKMRSLFFNTRRRMCRLILPSIAGNRSKA